MIRFT